MDETIKDKQLRVMLFIKSLGQGGAERQCCVLACQLAEAGHSVCVVIYNNTDAFYAPLLPESVQLVSLGHSRWNIAGLLLDLYRQTKLFMPDILYSFLSHSNLLTVMASPLIKARTVCGIRSSALDLSSESMLARFGEYLHLKSLSFADLIIANSLAAKSELITAGLPEAKVTVVANGIDAKRFQYNHKTRAEIRSSLGYTDNDRVIGLFARMHPMKGHHVLLKAFSEIAFEDSSLKLLLIGSGSEVPIDAHIGEEGLSRNVLLLEDCSDIERYYSAIDVYCSPSLYGEGFPNALAEAMSTGLPCIATDVGDSALIMSDFGQLVAAGDVRQLSDAIRNCSVERNEADTEARRQHIVRNFGLRQLGDRTILALRQVLGS